jgi:phosphoribosylformylglycinamidine cyclo-ligase
MTQESAYARSGVDIAAGQRATDLMAEAVRATYSPQVLAGMGAFGGMYDASGLKKMCSPVLVASTDSVGTKTKVAARMNRWDTIGRDLVNHCVNDILVQGARPLFFLDYVATPHLDTAQIATVVKGVAAACCEAGCALLAGETAELPGVYQAGEIDLVGAIVGVVERERVLDGSRIQAGDVILGLPSTGLHTNGYSLARHALDDLDWNVPLPELGCSPGEALLTIHRSYLQLVRQLWSADVDIRGLAHITGGGLVDNLPRILPQGVGAVIQRRTWPESPIFNLIQRMGNISDEEMFHVFNMGLGMLVMVPPEQVLAAQAVLGNDVFVVGEIAAGESGVEIIERERCKNVKRKTL